MMVGRAAVALVAAFLATGAVGDARAENGFYVGIEAGRNVGVGGDPGTTTGGAGFSGAVQGINLGDGLIAGASAGYRVSDLLRVGLGYTYLKNELDWSGNFGAGGITSFHGDIDSHVVLLEGFLHGRGFFPETFARVDPFIGGGVGGSWNRLRDVQEKVGTSIVSRPADDTKAGAAFRLAIGADVRMTEQLTFSLVASSYWLDGVRTGTTRNAAAQGLSANQPIGRWQVNDLNLVSVTAGLRYSF